MSALLITIAGLANAQTLHVATCTLQVSTSGCTLLLSISSATTIESLTVIESALPAPGTATATIELDAGSGVAVIKNSASGNFAFATGSNGYYGLTAAATSVANYGNSGVVGTAVGDSQTIVFTGGQSVECPQCQLFGRGRWRGRGRYFGVYGSSHLYPGLLAVGLYVSARSQGRALPAAESRAGADGLDAPICDNNRHMHVL
jgi:hypothetical protein